tara:strand:- start:1022 stop:2068 length:1047 start_codon:yes stop_codon:yes gene_type:complete
MKVAITGEKGFLGYHLTQYYKWVKEYEVIELGRDYLNNIKLLKDCDLLIHCAGVNKGYNVYQGNITLAQDLVNALNDNSIQINIKFTSSTQEDDNNKYGDSKIKAKQILTNYCDKNNTDFKSYKIPNIFGPFGKPNYNSFINTFCYNLIKNIDITYNDNLVTLCYVYDVIESIDNNTEFNTITIPVSDIYYKLKDFHNDYSQGIIPNLISKFDKDLFNTYRSFTSSLFKFTKHTDDRGHLVELVKGKGSKTQIFYSITKPGITRGDHFHFGKVERFCVITGKAKISIRKIGSNKKINYIIDGEDNKVIDMPILHTHNITNISNNNLVCIFWVNEIFNPMDTDTYFEKV